MASGPHNRAVPCPLCNEKFFPASLKFHQKQCAKRRAERVVNCPYCKIEISQIDLPDHVARCPKGAGGRKGQAGGDTGRGSGNASAPRPAPQDGQFEPEVLDDGRMRCVYCGRHFNPDRIEKHQDICGGLKNARPKGVDGQPTQTCRKVFNAAAQRCESGAAFMSPEQYDSLQRKKQQELERERAKKPSMPKWKREHEQFQAVCQAGRDDDYAPQGRILPSKTAPARSTMRSSQGPPPGTVPCPHCGRNFSADVADRHIPICAKVINRPKPPPSGAPPSPRQEPPDRMMRASTMREGDRTMRDAGRTMRPPRSPERGGPSASTRGQSSYDSPMHRRTTGSGGFGGGANGGFDDDSPPSPSSPAEPRGGGMRAARMLRSSTTTRLPPAARQSAANRHPSPQRSRTTGFGTPPKGRFSDREDTTDSTPRQTAAPAPAGPAGPAGGAAVGGAGGIAARIGLKRTALLYRLLSHVPEATLERELSESGTDIDGLDQEGLIEAVLEMLV